MRHLPHADVTARRTAIPWRSRSSPQGLDETATLMDRVGAELPDGVSSLRRLRREARRKETETARHSPYAELPSELRVEHCDFRDLEARTGDLTGKVNVLLTDPPWVNAFAGLLDPFGEFSARVLTPDGVLLCYTGGNTLPAFLDALRGHLTYRWNIVCLNSPRHGTDSKLMLRGWTSRDGTWRVCHRNVLVFTKGDSWRPHQVPDDVIAETEPRVVLHPKGWNQPVAESERLLSWFARPGSLVLDCFCGTGTSILACLRNGQGLRAIGCDADLACVKIARSRIKDELRALRAKSG